MDISLFKTLAYERRTECAVCRHPLPGPLIDLPHLPLSEMMVREPVAEPVGFLDQSFRLCKVCGHGQLENIIPPKVLYGSGYALRTSQSRAARSANDRIVSFVRGLCGQHNIKPRMEFKRIVEIGSNDLYLLQQLRPWLTMEALKADDALVGIDPVLAGREAEFPGIRVIADFFENADIPRLENALVITSHLLEHVREPRVFLERLLEKSDESTLFIFQFPTLEPLVADLRFDQIYHHHLHYFSTCSFTWLLCELGCEIVAQEIDLRYWGSLTVAFRKSARLFPETPGDLTARHFPFCRPVVNIIRNYTVFLKRMEATSYYLSCLAGERLIAYGAGLQLPILAYHLKNDFSTFESVVDDNKEKRGMHYLNLPVEICSLADIADPASCNVLITAIGFSRGILQKLLPLEPKRIIVPLNI